MDSTQILDDIVAELYSERDVAVGKWFGGQRRGDTLQAGGSV
jgi:hypothetical protein